jgi:hypothetical protein
MHTAAAAINLDELTKRLQALDGAENKQAIVRRLADVIEAAHARGASYKTICAALHADVPLTVSTLKTYLRRAKSKPIKHRAEAGRVHSAPIVDRAETTKTPVRHGSLMPGPTTGAPARSREDIISAGSFKPRADRSDL